MEMMSVMTSILGVVFGVFFAFDLFLTSKTEGTFIRQFITIITTSIPAIYTAINYDNNVRLAESWIYFYIAFGIILLLSFLWAYFFIYRILIRKLQLTTNQGLFTFFDFIYKGYAGFKEEVKTLQQDVLIARNNEINDHCIRTINSTLRSNVPKFVYDIYATIDESDLDGYIGYVLYEFIRKFLGECDARFTLHKLEMEKNIMKAIFSTNGENIPGDIDITQPNLISKSIEEAKPIFYSEYPEFHYKTKNDSISKGKYIDTMSLCIMQTEDNKPFYSISIDVKNVSDKERLKVLADSLFIDILANALTTKLQLENKNNSHIKENILEKMKKINNIVQQNNQVVVSEDNKYMINSII